MTRFVAAVILGLALWGAPPAQAQISKDALDKVRSDYVSAFNDGDAARVARLYTEDAIYLPASGERIDGRSAIEQHLQSEFKSGASDLKVQPQSTQQIGSASYDLGTYTMTAPGGPAGQKTSISGNYVVLLESAQGAPRIKVMIGNMKPQGGGP